MVGLYECKKELSTGLLRELEEKRIVVMPVMLEDCEVPVFARGKMFADFRKDFDVGLRSVIEGIAKATNPSQARFQEPTYHTDWSIDWGDLNGNLAIILNFIQIPIKQPYTCLTNIEILANPAATVMFSRNKKESGIDAAKLYVIAVLNSHLSASSELKLLLADERERVHRLELTGPSRGEGYSVRIGVRRLGEDTGRDILVNTTGLVAEAYKFMLDVLLKPSRGK